MNPPLIMRKYHTVTHRFKSTATTAYVYSYQPRRGCRTDGPIASERTHCGHLSLVEREPNNLSLVLPLLCVIKEEGMMIETRVRSLSCYAAL